MQVVLEETGVIISTVQASRLKEHGKSDELTLPMVRLILTEPKPIERKVTIKADKISRYFPEDYSNEQIENVIYQLLDEWNSSNSEKSVSYTHLISFPGGIRKSPKREKQS